MKSWNIGYGLRRDFLAVIAITLTLGAAPALRQASSPRPPANGLSQMQRAIKGAGTTIELGTNSGGAGAHDQDFTAY